MCATNLLAFCCFQSDLPVNRKYHRADCVNLVLITPTQHFCSPSFVLSRDSSLADLGFAFGDVVDSRSPEEEVTLLPRLLPVLLQPQDALDLRNRHRATAETLLFEAQKLMLTHDL